MTINGELLNEIVRSALKAAERAGYLRAASALRDREAYDQWCADGMADKANWDRSWPDYHHAPRFADYLEAREADQ